MNIDIWLIDNLFGVLGRLASVAAELWKNPVLHRCSAKWIMSFKRNV